MFIGHFVRASSANVMWAESSENSSMFLISSCEFRKQISSVTMRDSWPWLSNHPIPHHCQHIVTAIIFVNGKQHSPLPTHHHMHIHIAVSVCMRMTGSLLYHQVRRCRPRQNPRHPHQDT